MVPTMRLELIRLAPLPPQDSVSTNSTTSANSNAATRCRGIAKSYKDSYLGISPAFDAPLFAGTAGTGAAGAGAGTLCVCAGAVGILPMIPWE